MNKEKLNDILEKHKKWLKNEEGGEQADLSGANLSSADLRYADLRYANLNYVKFNLTTTFYYLQCPEKGSFTAFKTI